MLKWLHIAQSYQLCVTKRQGLKLGILTQDTYEGNFCHISKTLDIVAWGKKSIFPGDSGCHLTGQGGLQHYTSVRDPSLYFTSDEFLTRMKGLSLAYRHQKIQITYHCTFSPTIPLPIPGESSYLHSCSEVANLPEDRNNS